MDTREIMDRVSLCLGEHPEVYRDTSVFGLRGRADFLLDRAARGALECPEVAWQIGRIVYLAAALAVSTGIDLESAVAAALCDAEDRRSTALGDSGSVESPRPEVTPWPTPARPISIATR